MSNPLKTGSGDPSHLNLHTALHDDAGIIRDYSSLDRSLDDDAGITTWLPTKVTEERLDGDDTVTMRGLPLNIHLTRDQFPVPTPRFPKFMSESNNRDYILTNEVEPERSEVGVKIFVAQRVSDNKRFMAHTILKPTGNLNNSRPSVHIESWIEDDVARATQAFDRAQEILPYAGLSLMRLFNHPNLIKLIDIVQNSHFRGNDTQADYLVWEDCDGGSLARLLSPGENEAFVPEIRMPSNWMPMRTQAKIFEGFPEDFCWHVLDSIAKALMWLHFGVKERSGEPGQFDVHDDDWHPILHRNIEPSAIHFTQPRVRQTKYGKKLEPYGMCKLGGFGNAKVVGSAGSDFAMCERHTLGPYTAKVDRYQDNITYEKFRLK